MAVKPLPGQQRLQASVGTVPLSQQLAQRWERPGEGGLGLQSPSPGSRAHRNSRKVRPVLELRYGVWLTPHPCAWCFLPPMFWVLTPLTGSKSCVLEATAAATSCQVPSTQGQSLLPRRSRTVTHRFSPTSYFSQRRSRTPGPSAPDDVTSQSKERTPPLFTRGPLLLVPLTAAQGAVHSG